MFETDPPSLGDCCDLMPEQLWNEICDHYDDIATGCVRLTTRKCCTGCLFAEELIDEVVGGDVAVTLVSKTPFACDLSAEL